MSTYSPEEYKYHVNQVWRVTAILAIVTIVEVAIALLYNAFLHDSGLRIGLDILMVVAAIVKAFFIVSVFMHMKYERQAFRLTVLMPLVFFIWFIIAMLWEGNSWLMLRDLF